MPRRERLVAALNVTPGGDLGEGTVVWGDRALDGQEAVRAEGTRGTRDKEGRDSSGAGRPADGGGMIKNRMAGRVIAADEVTGETKVEEERGPGRRRGRGWRGRENGCRCGGEKAQ